MPLKYAIALRVWLPLAVVALYFGLRLPTQAAAGLLEMCAAFLFIPLLILLAGWSAAELMFRPAALKLDEIVADEVGEPTEPMLLTHEFQPASGELFTMPDDWHTGHLALYNSRVMSKFMAATEPGNLGAGDQTAVVHARIDAALASSRYRSDPVTLFHSLGGHYVNTKNAAIRSEVD